MTVFFNHGIRGQDDYPDDTDEYGWDTHNDIFDALGNRQLPRFDATIRTSATRSIVTSSSRAAARRCSWTS